MKTRKLAAKALSVAVVATTVSGYAMAGDHSITADPSFEYCTQTHKKGAENSHLTPLNGGTGDGSCGAMDVQLNFSGNLGDGWNYSFNVDFSDLKARYEDENTGAGSTAGGLGKKDLRQSKTAGSDTQASVLLTKDLGNGITLKFGDVGDVNETENASGHWEMVGNAGTGGTGSMGVSYAKGAIAANLSYGTGASNFDSNATSINVGANYTMGKLNIGGSYHQYSPSDTAKNCTGSQTCVGEKVVIGATDVTGKSAMAFGVKYDLGKFSIAADYLMKTTTTYNAGAESEAKDNDMGIHFWGTEGTFQPAFSYMMLSDEPASGAKTSPTAMAAGVKWVPNWKNVYVRGTYKSISTDPESDTGTYSVISIKIGTSATIL